MNTNSNKKDKKMSDYLMSKCFDRIIQNHDALCRDKNCDEAVKQEPITKRWYITMGHAGFNTNANNGNGYATKDSALAAMKKYLGDDMEYCEDCNAELKTDVEKEDGVCDLCHKEELELEQLKKDIEEKMVELAKLQKRHNDLTGKNHVMPIYL